MKYTENQIITAMKGTGGIVSQIINNLSKLANNETITRQGLTDRIQKSEILKQAYEAEQDHIGDIVETGFFKALQDQKEWAMKEWFRYKGWTRGYVQKQEVNASLDFRDKVIAKYGAQEGKINEVPRPEEIESGPSTSSP